MSQNRFEALRAIRAERKDEGIQDSQDSVSPIEEAALSSPKPNSAQAVMGTTKKSSSSNSAKSQSRKEILPAEPKRGPGRPKGRRSNPDYTQISAYIPLDLLLAVQDALADERRIMRQRTARPVSDLVEELLADWLQNRNIKKSAN